MSESDNWQPPTPPQQPFVEPTIVRLQKHEYAGFWIRLIAYFCDYLNSLVVIVPIEIIRMLVSDTPSVSDADGFAAFPGYAWSAPSAWLIPTTIASIIVLAYWTGSRGGSPLRVRLGVLVLDENDGSYIGTKRAIYRGLMSLVSRTPIWLGYFWVLWDPKRQTWHDKVVKSVVVWRR
jgi:uncharacterized RDD family membrane protein YckC